MTIDKLAPGVWRTGTRYVNWYIVDAGEDGVTVVDCGLPGYHEQIEPALQEAGRKLSDVNAVVLTHGHVDHTGSADTLAGGGARVYLHPSDVDLAVDPGLNRTQRSILRYAYWPATLAFAVHAVSNGALRRRAMPASSPLVDGQILDVPGRPTVIHTPGHTEGHCALEFADHGVAFVGDLLCTSDPFSGRPVAPRVQTRGSNLSSDRAMQALDRLAGVGARLVLPGHGRPWHDGIEAAVESARQYGCR